LCEGILVVQMDFFLESAEISNGKQKKFPFKSAGLIWICAEESELFFWVDFGVRYFQWKVSWLCACSQALVWLCPVHMCDTTHMCDMRDTHVCKRATNYRSLLRKVTYENKAPYDSTYCHVRYDEFPCARAVRRTRLAHVAHMTYMTHPCHMYDIYDVMHLLCHIYMTHPFEWKLS